MKVLLPVFYLPPISWWAVFLKPETEVTFEVFENFPKQTYRNRAMIYGANGKLPLIIPISHTGERVMKNIEFSARERWQELHWKSIKTAYQTSPYFEYYEDRLEEIYKFKTSKLLDFNLNALQILQQILKTEKSFLLSSAYVAEPAEKDYRQSFSAKKPAEANLSEYFQSFQAKAGFLPDLSVLDLICNKGPEALTYLQTVQTK